MSLHIYQSSASLAEGLASWIVGNINLVLRTQGRYSFALSGGSTPKLLYQLMASEYAQAADWSKVDFFFGDERFVSMDDERNNGKMALDLFLHPLGIKDEQIFAIPTNSSPQNSVSAYQKTLEEYFHSDDTHSFDFVLLGMGADAHTLSLFPGGVLPDDKAALVAHTFNKADQLDRITLLPSIINYAKTIAFMVQGKEKSDTLKRVLHDTHDPDKYPAQLILPASGQLMWFADEAAAGAIIL